MKKLWKWIVGATVAVALLLGITIRRRRVRRLLDAAAVAKATAEIDALKAVRAHVIEAEGEASLALARLDREIFENKKTIVRAYEEMESVPDDQIETEFARLGY